MSLDAPAAKASTSADTASRTLLSLGTKSARRSASGRFAAFGYRMRKANSEDGWFQTA